jgi:hypothetical protein
MTDAPAGPTPEHPLPAQRDTPGPPSIVTLLLDMQQQIARVEGTQIALVRQMQNADQSRREIHRKLDTVSDKATAAAHRAELAVTRAEHAVASSAALKPSVDDYVTMRGYVRTGLWALGLIVMPLIGLLGYGAMQVYQYVVAHLDLTRLWKQ